MCAVRGKCVQYVQCTFTPLTQDAVEYADGWGGRVWTKGVYYAIEIFIRNVPTISMAHGHTPTRARTRTQHI